MPRIALLCLCLVGACRFDADYSGGMYHCSDGECPPGLVCRDDLQPPICTMEPQDAAIDGRDGLMDAPDARPHALTCDDPQVLAMNGDSDMDTTDLRMNKVAPMCTSGVFMLGPDAIYRITPGAGRQMLVTIDASYAATAYVLSPCAASACVGTKYATPANPISITTLAGDMYIVVDSNLSAASGPYTLTISF